MASEMTIPGLMSFRERNGGDDSLTTYTRSLDLSRTLDGAGGIGGLLARSDRQQSVPAILTPPTLNPQGVVNSYYFSDANGNVTALVSPSGMLLAHYEYGPFGNVVAMDGLMAAQNKYRFSSKEWNDNSGLYYFGYRFCEPSLQRWLNRDPLGESERLDVSLPLATKMKLYSNAQADQKLFSFANDDPINANDLFGLRCMHCQHFQSQWHNPILRSFPVMGYFVCYAAWQNCNANCALKYGTSSGPDADCMSVCMFDCWARWQICNGKNWVGGAPKVK